MRVLFDTDVVLDLLPDRQPHSEPAAHLFSRVESGEIDGHICATAFATIYSLANKLVGSARAKIEVQKLLSLLEIAPVNRPVLEGTLGLGFKDFEDAVARESARQVNVQAIVTRNLRDFRLSEIPAYSPSDMLNLLEIEDDNGG